MISNPGLGFPNQISIAVDYAKQVLDQTPYDRLPSDWLKAQLAYAAGKLQFAINGEHEHLIESITSLKAGLDKLTDNSPKLLRARFHRKLGEAYLWSHRLGEPDTLTPAFDSLRRSIDVLSPLDAPIELIGSKLLLASTHVSNAEWQEADALYAETFTTFKESIRRSRGIALSSEIRSSAMRSMRMAPFVALKCGDVARALEYSESIRSRQLTEAFILEAIPPSDGGEEDGSGLENLRARGLGMQLFRSSSKGDLKKILDYLIEVTQQAKELRDQIPIAESDFNLSEFLDQLTDWVFVPFFVDRQARLVMLRPHSTIDDVIVSDIFEFGFDDIFHSLVGDGIGKSVGWLSGQRKFAESGDFGDLNKHLTNDIPEALWAWFGSWIKQTLEENALAKIDKLIVVPNGPVGLLPIGLARNPTDGKHLLDDFAVTFSPNLRAIVRNARLLQDRNRKLSPKSKTLGIIENPTGNSPSAGLEASMAASFFPRECVYRKVGAECTRENIVETLPKSDHWHISAHGKFDLIEPHESVLKVADGKSLKLRHLPVVRPESQPVMVHLSACESGHNDFIERSEDFFGFPTAFMQLGAINVIGTLWPTSDETSTLIGARFYELYAGEGQSPSIALKNAQIWLRNETAGSLRNYLVQWIRIKSDYPRLA